MFTLQVNDVIQFEIQAQVSFWTGNWHFIEVALKKLNNLLGWCTEGSYNEKVTRINTKNFYLLLAEKVILDFQHVLELGTIVNSAYLLHYFG